MGEQITMAAISFTLIQSFCDPEYPNIMTGRRHNEIFEKMFKLGIQYGKKNAVQGFFTNYDHFLDRYDAKTLAMNNGQLQEDTGMAQLYSEDLW